MDQIPDTSLIPTVNSAMNQVPPTDGNAALNFNVITPQAFNLAEMPDEAKSKLKEEVMDRVRTSEKNMSSFYNDYMTFADSWRVRPRKTKNKKPNGLFNSKSGETHRAVETLGTFWLRSMTATDKYFEAMAEGLDDFGNEITPEQLYATENVIAKQLRISHYKEKLMRALTSVGLLGTSIFEEPWVKVPYRNGTAKFEYTDFVFRSLLKVMFDTNVWDINLSSFMATVDFPDKYYLRSMAKNDSEYWDGKAISEYLLKTGDLGMNNANSLNASTGAWNRVNESKQRAGYTQIDNNVFELINYHGKIDVENDIVGRYWESEGRQDDPSDFDFTIGVLNGDPVVRFHETQFGTWHSRFKVAHFKTFEDEGIGYGVGRLGRKIQHEIDTSLSRASDTAMKGVYSMYLVGRYAGLKANQLQINPNGLIDVEDVDQVKPLPIDIRAISEILSMIAGRSEEFRSTVSAPTNLQGQVVKSSATEAAIAQNEGFRNASVHAELIAETFLREHIETMHYNNLEYLDEPIWVHATGDNKPGFYNKENLPKFVGIDIKVATDKDFNKPERAAAFLKGLELWSSIRQNFPPSVNAIPVLAKEWFKTMDLDPAILSKPLSVKDQLAMAMQQAVRGGQMPGQEIQGETAGVQGNNSNSNTLNTPKGPVQTSPLGNVAAVRNI